MVHWNLIKRRQIIVAQVISLMIFLTGFVLFSGDEIVAIQGSDKLTILERFQIPLLEVSGIDWRESEGRLQLLAVGDKAPTIAVIDLESKLASISDFSSLLESRFSLCHSIKNPSCKKMLKRLGSDWEALKVDQRGNVFLLQEHSESIIQLDRELNQILSVINFDLLETQSQQIQNTSPKFLNNSLGEGLILAGNKIIVAKEQFPASLVIFGQEGEDFKTTKELLAKNREMNLENGRQSLVGIKHWELSGHSKCDFSDLAYYDNFIVILSQRCKQMYFIKDMPVNSTRLVPDIILNLPAEIKDPEGLTILPDGKIVIASDSKKAKNNAYILEFTGWKLKVK